MTDCYACTLAESDPATGHFRNGCPECDARALAQSPMFHESAKAGHQMARYRDALHRLFPGSEDDAHERAKAWAKRIDKAPAQRVLPIEGST